MAERNAAISAVLHEPRISPRGQLVVAEWDEGRGAAVVRKFAGKHWEALGHSESVVSLGHLFVQGFRDSRVMPPHLLSLPLNDASSSEFQ